MTATKRLSPSAIVALKEALQSAYWYKSDLRGFLQNCLSDKTLTASRNWNNYKWQIVADLVDQLCVDQDRYLPDLTRLCYELTNLNSFYHLEQLEGGAEKAARARTAIKQLQELLRPHEELKREADAVAERQKHFREQLKANAAVREKLKELNERFLTVVSPSDPQQRGYELEKLMYDLFELFDLDPKASFKNTGEQIDGVFSLEGTDYLFEAKWQEASIGVQALDAFSAKVERKLENTLGVFLSMNGFSPDAIAAHSRARPSIILMDGSDMMAVLEERIDFVSLLLRKKRRASQTGNIYFPFRQFST
jgi:hypothetical protein